MVDEIKHHYHDHFSEYFTPTEYRLFNQGRTSPALASQ
jgi:hypothetical protein